VRKETVEVAEGWEKERQSECKGQAKTFLGASPENQRHTTAKSVR
jgi:hypothetical protein